MSLNSPEYVMCLSSLGAYRLQALQLVKEELGRRLLIITGDRAFDPSTRLIGEDGLDHTKVHNRFLPGEILIQNLPWSKLIRCDALMLDLNPRIPHVWLLVALRRLLKKRTILWGHVWPRAGRLSKTNAIRALLRRLPNAVVTYTHTEAQELRSIIPECEIFTAPNALYRVDQLGFDPNSTRTDIIYVGRLIKAKKVDLLIEAFSQLFSNFPTLRLVIIGDGEEIDALREQSLHTAACSRILFRGHSDNIEILRSAYRSAVVSVSPGYVGLSIIQSLGFGVPMVIADDEPHAPEIEAAVPGMNCAFFQAGSAGALRSALESVLKSQQEWQQRGQAISRYCINKYSAEAMSQGLIAALEGLPA